MSLRRVYKLIFLFSLLNFSALAFAHEDCGGEDFTTSLRAQMLACKRASATQISEVKRGNSKLNDFLDYCGRNTEGSNWCQQLIRPNPASASTFRCTYGDNLPHTLVHPDQATWKYAAQAVRLVERLEQSGVKVCEIYNWWRPEPYNKNVAGAASRHPAGTSVDVRFCSLPDTERAHKILCAWRKQGALRALGHYGSTGLHLGIGDTIANTWGKSCP
jgi:hypothetical protein